MHEIIAVIFDFDDTLAPDSTSGYLNELGLDMPKFWREEVQQLLEDDWDPIPAYLYKMIEKSNSTKALTRFLIDYAMLQGKLIQGYRLNFI